MNEDKELNLWDKIIEAKDTNPTAKVLFVEDAKEFIRLLKEECENWQGDLTAQIVSEIIDKLAGKLIEDYSKPSLTELRGL